MIKLKLTCIRMWKR